MYSIKFNDFQLFDYSNILTFNTITSEIIMSEIMVLQK